MPCVLRSRSNVGNARIYDGSDIFKAEQLCRIFDVKTPPFEQCRITPLSGVGATIEQDEDWVPLGLRLVREHALSWNLNGTILNAPMPTAWWIPYYYKAIMRYGHSVNSSIPEDPNEAEFPGQ
jgi:hypothetical protein